MLINSIHTSSYDWKKSYTLYYIGDDNIRKYIEQHISIEYICLNWYDIWIQQNKTRCVSFINRIPKTFDYDNILDYDRIYVFMDILIKHDPIDINEWVNSIIKYISTKEQYLIFYVSACCGWKDMYTLLKKKSNLRFNKKQVQKQLSNCIGYTNIMDCLCTQWISFKQILNNYLTKDEWFFLLNTIIVCIDDSYETFHEMQDIYNDLYDISTMELKKVLLVCSRFPINKLYKTARLLETYNVYECDKELSCLFIEKQLTNRSHTEWIEYAACGESESYMEKIIPVDWSPYIFNTLNSYITTDIIELLYNYYKSFYPMYILRTNIYKLDNYFFCEYLIKTSSMHDKIYNLQLTILHDAFQCFYLYFDSIYNTDPNMITKDILINCIRHLNTSNHKFNKKFVKAIHRYSDIYNILIDILLQDSNYSFLFNYIDINTITFDTEYKHTQEQCIVSYEIPQQYFQCTSNIPHVVSVDVFYRLPNKICPYCRSTYTPKIFINDSI